MLGANIYNVILEPVYSEKATVLNEQSKYTFKVAKSATKLDVKNAIEKIFEVKVLDVNIINTKGKVKVFKGVKGNRSGYKKAIVSLEKGKVIEFTRGA